MKEETLNIVEIQMPCIIAVQVGLVALLKSFGVEPSAVLGHSSGEMVAAWSIGVADLEALCKVTYARASGQQNAMPEEVHREMLRQLRDTAAAVLRRLYPAAKITVA